MVGGSWKTRDSAALRVSEPGHTPGDTDRRPQFTGGYWPLRQADAALAGFDRLNGSRTCRNAAKDWSAPPGHIARARLLQQLGAGPAIERRPRTRATRRWRGCISASRGRLGASKEPRWQATAHRAEQRDNAMGAGAAKHSRARRQLASRPNICGAGIPPGRRCAAPRYLVQQFHGLPFRILPPAPALRYNHQHFRLRC